MGSMEYRTCCWSIEKLAGFALVRTSLFQTRVELFLATLQTGHAIRKSDLDEILFAYFFAGERGKEIHKIPFMIPLFHTTILASFWDCFCVNPIGIINFDGKSDPDIDHRLAKRSAHHS
jgi:hypothetical protein